jgi:hypothetical protein
MFDVSGPLNIRATICSLPAVDMIWKLSRLNEDPTKPALPRLLDVLADSRLCLSTFPIDKVYGVLGLVRDEDASKIKIDYGNKPADVYKQIAMMELERIGIDILYYCTNSGEVSIVECPSWVPDWSQPCYHDAFIRLGYRSSAGGSSKASFQVENDALIIKGRIVDTIQAVELTRKIPTGSEPGKMSNPRDLLTVIIRFLLAKIQTTQERMNPKYEKRQTNLVSKKLFQMRMLQFQFQSLKWSKPMAVTMHLYQRTPRNSLAFKTSTSSQTTNGSQIS